MSVENSASLPSVKKKIHPTPCFSSAGDISRAAVMDELSGLASNEIISKFLLKMLEYENKVDSAFNRKEESQKSHQNFNNNVKIPFISEQISLPELPDVDQYQPPSYKSEQFSKSGFLSNPQTNLHAPFLHPKLNYMSFNESITELAHFATAVQFNLKILSEIRVYPVPFRTLIVKNQNKFPLFVPDKAPRDSENIFPTLASNLKEFATYIDMVVTSSAEVFHLSTDGLVPFDVPTLNDFLVEGDAESIQASNWPHFEEQHSRICDFLIQVLTLHCEQHLRGYQF